jgi:hypothetical protein
MNHGDHRWNVIASTREWDEKTKLVYDSEQAKEDELMGKVTQRLTKHEASLQRKEDKLMREVVYSKRLLKLQKSEDALIKFGKVAAAEKVRQLREPLQVDETDAHLKEFKLQAKWCDGPGAG